MCKTKVCPQCRKNRIAETQAVCYQCEEKLERDRNARRLSHQRILADIQRRDTELYRS